MLFAKYIHCRCWFSGKLWWFCRFILYLYHLIWTCLVSLFHSVRPFGIYQECPFGVRQIDFFQETGLKDGSWGVERVVYLNKGDKVYIRVFMKFQAQISLEERANIFGMFEIWNTCTFRQIYINKDWFERWVLFAFYFRLFSCDKIILFNWYFNKASWYVYEMTNSVRLYLHSAVYNELSLQINEGNS